MTLAFAPLMAAAALLAVAAPAGAADYPIKAIKLVVPYSAGGSTDARARLVGEKLTQRLGQPVVVENKPGAAEQIAITSVTKAPPDGYTLLVSTFSGLAVNPSLYGSKLPYDPNKDLVPVSLAATVPTVVVVHPTVPAKTMAELAAFIKSKPGAVSYASAGNGTPSHLGMESYKKITGLDAVHVPYKSNPNAITDLLGGQIDFMITDTSTGVPQVKGGKLKALGVSTTERNPLLPEVPTIAEAGVKGYDMGYWFAAYAPAGTPPAAVAKLRELLAAATQSAGAKNFFDSSGSVAWTTSPEALAKFQADETAKWGKVIKAAGIEPE